MSSKIFTININISLLTLLFVITIHNELLAQIYDMHHESIYLSLLWPYGRPYKYHQWPLLLTWFNFNPSMDK